MPARGAGIGANALTARVLALLLAFVSLAAEPQIHYTRHSSIKIPYNIDPNEKRIRQVLLYVSEDEGKSFSQVAAVTAGEREFKFNARRDGWYWFATQTQDNQGQLNPPTIQQLQAGLKICLDTVPPQVTLRGASPRDYPVGVEWDIRDEAADVLSMRLDYRPVGGPNWLPLSPPQVVQGQFGWNPTVGGALEVRLQVRDRAGNQSEQTTTVQAGLGNPNPNPNPGPGPGPGPGGVLPGPTPSNVYYVPKRRVSLNYDVENVGKSQVQEVEVWVTEDGRSWTKYNTTKPSKTYTVELAQERRYGFTLVAVSGVGLAERRPLAGDPPQVWVEVDETRPQVRLLAVDVGQGQETGKMSIRWVATDKHLEATPITLSYGTDAQGPWTTIEKSLANDGRYIWQMPPQEGLPFQMFIRVEAVDRAGNVSFDMTQRPVAVDLLVPKAKVIGVTPAQPGPTGPP